MQTIIPNKPCLVTNLRLIIQFQICSQQQQKPAAAKAKLQQERILSETLPQPTNNNSNPQ